MKKLFVLFYALMCLVTLQAQKVTLQDVANGTYRAQSIQGLKPMLDGEHYTQISKDHKRIVKYSFKTGKEVATIFDVATARNHKLKNFDDYIMSPDESLILIQTETKPIYRRSFTAVYYIYNVRNRTLDLCQTTVRSRFLCSHPTVTRLRLCATTTSTLSNCFSVTANHK